MKVQPLNQKITHGNASQKKEFTHGNWTHWTKKLTVEKHLEKKNRPWKLNPLNKKIKCGNKYPKEEFTLVKSSHWTKIFNNWINLKLECSTIEYLESLAIGKKLTMEEIGNQVSQIWPLNKSNITQSPLEKKKKKTLL